MIRILQPGSVASTGGCDSVATGLLATAVTNVSDIHAASAIAGVHGRGSLVYSLGNVIEGTPAIYDLCWKAKDVERARFVWIGTWALAGPYALNSTVQCSQGVSCVVRLSGVEFEMGNRVGISRNQCAQDFSDYDPVNLIYLPGRNPLGPTEEYRGFEVLYEKYDFGSISAGEAGTFYLCWGKSDDLLNVRLGQITFEGVNWEVHFCWLGFQCDITVRGVGLRAANALQVLQNNTGECTRAETDKLLVSDAEISSIFNPRMDSKPVVGAQPANSARLYAMGFIDRADVVSYKICFAENQYVTPPAVPRFFIEAGILSLSGPDQDGVISSCIMGESCSAGARGVNLRQDNIAQLIFGEQCPNTQGIAFTPITWTGIRPGTTNDVYDVNTFNGTGTNNSNAEGFATQVFFDLGVIIGAHPARLSYFLCWAQEWGALPFLRAGRIDLTGPGNLAVHSSVAGTTRCIIGRQCIILLRNTFVTSSNYIRVLKPGVTCDDTNPDNLVKADKFTNPFPVDQDNFDLYTIGFPVVNSTAVTAGGLGYKLCWGHDPKVLADGASSTSLRALEDDGGMHGADGDSSSQGPQDDFGYAATDGDDGDGRVVHRAPRRLSTSASVPTVFNNINYNVLLSKMRVPVGYLNFPGPLPRDVTCYFFRLCRFQLPGAAAADYTLLDRVAVIDLRKRVPSTGVVNTGSSANSGTTSGSAQLALCGELPPNVKQYDKVLDTLPWAFRTRKYLPDGAHVMADILDGDEWLEHSWQVEDNQNDKDPYNTWNFGIPRLGEADRYTLCWGENPALSDPVFAWYSHHYMNVGWFSMELTAGCRLGDPCPVETWFFIENTTLALIDDENAACGAKAAQAVFVGSDAGVGTVNGGRPLYADSYASPQRVKTNNLLTRPDAFQVSNRSDPNFGTEEEVQLWSYSLPRFERFPSHHYKFCEVIEEAAFEFCREFWYLFTGVRNVTLNNETVGMHLPNVTLGPEEYILFEVDTTADNVPVNVSFNPCGEYPSEFNRAVIAPRTNGTSNLPPEHFTENGLVKFGTFVDADTGADVSVSVQPGTGKLLSPSSSGSTSKVLAFIENKDPVASLVVSGPYFQRKTCELGANCTLFLDGVGSRESDFIFLSKNATHCSVPTTIADALNYTRALNALKPEELKEKIEQLQFSLNGPSEDPLGDGFLSALPIGETEFKNGTIPPIVRGLHTVVLPDLSQSDVLFHDEPNRYGKKKQAVYELGIATKVTAGYVYGICGFNDLPIGELVFIGPDIEDGDVRNCTLGMPCVVKVEGASFSTDNMILLSPKETCAESDGSGAQRDMEFSVAAVSSQNIAADAALSHVQLNDFIFDAILRGELNGTDAASYYANLEQAGGVTLEHHVKATHLDTSSTTSTASANGTGSNVPQYSIGATSIEAYRNKTLGIGVAATSTNATTGTNTNQVIHYLRERALFGPWDQLLNPAAVTALITSSTQGGQAQHAKALEIFDLNVGYFPHAGRFSLCWGYNIFQGIHPVQTEALGAAVVASGTTSSSVVAGQTGASTSATSNATTASGKKVSYTTTGFLNPPANTIEARYNFHDFRLKLADFFLYGPLQVATNSFRFPPPNATAINSNLAKPRLRNQWFEAGIDISFSMFGGVNNGTLFCYLALECEIDVDGVGLRDFGEDQGLMLVHRDEECYSAKKEAILITNIRNPTNAMTYLGEETDRAPGTNGYRANTVTVQRFRFNFDRLAGAAPAKKGPYRICWGFTGPRKNNDADMAPFVEDRVPYGVEIGSLLVFGPMFRTFDCVAGTRCDVLVEGTGLSAAKNRIFLVSGGNCFTVINFMYEFYVEKSNIPANFELDENTAAASFFHSVESYSTVTNNEGGVTTTTQKSNLRYSEQFLSSVDVSAANLHELNITRVANYRPKTILVGPVSVTPGLEMASTLNQYSMSALSVRGSDRFEACYLADLETSLNSVSFGFINIIGPRPAVGTYTCVLGSPCILGVTGLQLKRGVNLLAINRSPECKEETVLQMPSKAFTNPALSGFDVGLAIREGYLQSWEDAEYYFNADEIAEQAREAANGNKQMTANPKDSTSIHYHHFGLPLGDAATFAGSYYFCWRDSPGREYTMVGSVDLVAPTLVERERAFECVLGRDCGVDIALNGFGENAKSEFRWGFIPGGAEDTTSCYHPEFDGLLPQVDDATPASGETSPPGAKPLEIDFVARTGYFEGLKAMQTLDWGKQLEGLLGSSGGNADEQGMNGNSTTSSTGTDANATDGSAPAASVVNAYMGASVTVSFGVPRNARPGRYLLCWSKQGRGHRIKVAEVHLRGPLAQQSDCTLGVACGLTLSSPTTTSFTLSDRVKLLTTGFGENLSGTNDAIAKLFLGADLKGSLQVNVTSSGEALDQNATAMAEEMILEGVFKAQSDLCNIGEDLHYVLQVAYNSTSASTSTADIALDLSPLIRGSVAYSPIANYTDLDALAASLITDRALFPTEESAGSRIAFELADFQDYISGPWTLCWQAGEDIGAGVPGNTTADNTASNENTTSGTTAAATPAALWVPFGNLDVVGPTKQLFNCNLGARCVLEIAGYGAKFGELTSLVIVRKVNGTATTAPSSLRERRALSSTEASTGGSSSSENACSGPDWQIVYDVTPELTVKQISPTSQSVSVDTAFANLPTQSADAETLFLCWRTSAASGAGPRGPASSSTLRAAADFTRIGSFVVSGPVAAADSYHVYCELGDSYCDVEFPYIGTAAELRSNLKVSYLQLQPIAGGHAHADAQLVNTCIDENRIGESIRLQNAFRGSSKYFETVTSEFKLGAIKVGEPVGWTGTYRMCWRSSFGNSGGASGGAGAAASAAAPATTSHAGHSEQSGAAAAGEAYTSAGGQGTAMPMPNTMSASSLSHGGTQHSTAPASSYRQLSTYAATAAGDDTQARWRAQYNGVKRYEFQTQFDGADSGTIYDIGRITFFGPLETDVYCALGEHCVAGNLSGTFWTNENTTTYDAGLSALGVGGGVLGRGSSGGGGSSNATATKGNYQSRAVSVVVLDSAASSGERECRQSPPVSLSNGIKNSYVTTSASFENPVVQTDTTAGESTFVFGTPTRGIAGIYALCWRRKEVFGRFHLTGPLFGSARPTSCPLGITDCRIRLEGHEFSATNHLLLKTNGNQNGHAQDDSARKTVAWLEKGKNPVPVQPDLRHRLYSFGRLNSDEISPGIYSMYWGETGEKQSISTDVLVIQGPQVKSLTSKTGDTGFVCKLGEECVVTLEGVALQSFNRLKVLAYERLKPVAMRTVTSTFVSEFAARDENGTILGNGTDVYGTRTSVVYQWAPQIAVEEEDDAALLAQQLLGTAAAGSANASNATVPANSQQNATASTNLAKNISYIPDPNFTVQELLSDAVEASVDGFLGFPKNPIQPTSITRNAETFNFGIPFANASRDYRMYWHVDSGKNEMAGMLDKKIAYEWITVGGFQILGPVIPNATVTKILRRYGMEAEGYFFAKNDSLEENAGGGMLAAAASASAEEISPGNDTNATSTGNATGAANGNASAVALLEEEAEANSTAITESAGGATSPAEDENVKAFEFHSCFIGKFCSIAVDFVGDRTDFEADNSFKIRKACGLNDTFLLKQHAVDPLKDEIFSTDDNDVAYSAGRRRRLTHNTPTTTPAPLLTPKGLSFVPNFLPYGYRPTLADLAQQGYNEYTQAKTGYISYLPADYPSTARNVTGSQFENAVFPADSSFSRPELVFPPVVLPQVRDLVLKGGFAGAVEGQLVDSGSGADLLLRDLSSEGATSSSTSSFSTDLLLNSLEVKPNAETAAALANKTIYRYEFGLSTSLPTFSEYELCWSSNEVLLSPMKLYGPLDSNLGKLQNCEYDFGGAAAASGDNGTNGTTGAIINGTNASAVAPAPSCMVKLAGDFFPKAAVHEATAAGEADTSSENDTNATSSSGSGSAPAETGSNASATADAAPSVVNFVRIVDDYDCNSANVLYSGNLQEYKSSGREEDPATESAQHQAADVAYASSMLAKPRHDELMNPTATDLSIYNSGQVNRLNAFNAYVVLPENEIDENQPAAQFGVEISGFHRADNLTVCWQYENTTSGSGGGSSPGTSANGTTAITSADPWIRAGFVTFTTPFQCTLGRVCALNVAGIAQKAVAGNPIVQAAVASAAEQKIGQSNDTAVMRAQAAGILPIYTLSEDLDSCASNSSLFSLLPPPETIAAVSAKIEETIEKLLENDTMLEPVTPDEAVTRQNSELLSDARRRAALLSYGLGTSVLALPHAVGVFALCLSISRVLLSAGDNYTTTTNATNYTTELLAPAARYGFVTVNGPTARYDYTQEQANSSFKLLDAHTPNTLVDAAGFFQSGHYDYLRLRAGTQGKNTTSEALIHYSTNSDAESLAPGTSVNPGTTRLARRMPSPNFFLGVDQVLHANTLGLTHAEFLQPPEDVEMVNNMGSYVVYPGSGVHESVRTLLVGDFFALVSGSGNGTASRGSTDVERVEWNVVPSFAGVVSAGTAFYSDDVAAVDTPQDVAAATRTVAAPPVVKTGPEGAVEAASGTAELVEEPALFSGIVTDESLFLNHTSYVRGVVDPTKIMLDFAGRVENRTNFYTERGFLPIATVDVNATSIPTILKNSSVVQVKVQTYASDSSSIVVSDKRTNRTVEYFVAGGGDIGSNSTSTAGALSASLPVTVCQLGEICGAFIEADTTISALEANANGRIANGHQVARNVINLFNYNLSSFVTEDNFTMSLNDQESRVNAVQEHLLPGYDVITSTSIKICDARHELGLNALLDLGYGEKFLNPGRFDPGSELGIKAGLNGLHRNASLVAIDENSTDFEREARLQYESNLRLYEAFKDVDANVNLAPLPLENEITPIGVLREVYLADNDVTYRNFETEEERAMVLDNASKLPRDYFWGDVVHNRLGVPLKQRASFGIVGRADVNMLFSLCWITENTVVETSVDESKLASDSLSAESAYLQSVVTDVRSRLPNTTADLLASDDATAGAADEEQGSGSNGTNTTALPAPYIDYLSTTTTTPPPPPPRRVHYSHRTIFEVGKIRFQGPRTDLGRFQCTMGETCELKLRGVMSKPHKLGIYRKQHVDRTLKPLIHCSALSEKNLVLRLGIKEIVPMSSGDDGLRAAENATNLTSNGSSASSSAALRGSTNSLAVTSLLEADDATNSSAQQVALAAKAKLLAGPFSGFFASEILYELSAAQTANYELFDPTETYEVCHGPHVLVNELAFFGPFPFDPEINLRTGTIKPVNSLVTSRGAVLGERYGGPINQYYANPPSLDILTSTRGPPLLQNLLPFPNPVQDYENGLVHDVFDGGLQALRQETEEIKQQTRVYRALRNYFGTELEVNKFADDHAYLLSLADYAHREQVNASYFYNITNPMRGLLPNEETLRNIGLSDPRLTEFKPQLFVGEQQCLHREECIQFEALKQWQLTNRAGMVGALYQKVCLYEGTGRTRVASPNGTNATNGTNSERGGNSSGSDNATNTSTAGQEQQAVEIRGCVIELAGRFNARSGSGDGRGALGLRKSSDGTNSGGGSCELIDGVTRLELEDEANSGSAAADYQRRDVENVARFNITSLVVERASKFQLCWKTATGEAVYPGEIYFLEAV